MAAEEGDESKEENGSEQEDEEQGQLHSDGSAQHSRCAFLSLTCFAICCSSSQLTGQ